MILTIRTEKISNANYNINWEYTHINAPYLIKVCLVHKLNIWYTFHFKLLEESMTAL